MRIEALLRIMKCKLIITPSHELQTILYTSYYYILTILYTSYIILYYLIYIYYYIHLKTLHLTITCERK